MENNSNNSRTKNFVKNTVVGILMQFFSLVLSFASRTIFIRLLTNDYLSVNGLFSNILSTLSAMELGFGTALIFFMYKPVAVNDKEKIKQILKYYKKVYRTIGILMLSIGILLIPFMDYIIKDAPVINDNLNVIYILFLLSTVLGYFNSHNIAIINAYQKNYVISIYEQIFKWVQLILQIIVLLCFKNYILYLLIQLICVILNCFVISYKAKKMFPFIKDKSKTDLSKNEKKLIGTKVKSLIFYRLNPAILNGSDNIILSSIVGIKYVGIYSNYYLIISYLSMFISKITASLEIGVGNLNAIATKEKKEEVFYNSFFLCFFIHSIVCILLMALTNDFIKLWIGDNYLVSNFSLLTIILVLFVNGMQFSCYTFRTTAGLFEKNRLVPLYEIIVNIIVSIILSKFIGFSGVFLGTSIARISTIFWTDPNILYDKLFEKNNKKKYYFKYLKYTIITFLVGILAFIFSNYFVVGSYIGWIVKAIVLAIIVIFAILLLTFNMDECKVFLINIKNLLFKKKVKE